MSIAFIRGWRKGVRSFLQTLAGGGFTGVIALLAGGLSPLMASILTIGSGAIIAYLQNYLESAGKIPILLPTPGLVSPVMAPTVADPVIAPPAAATVDAVVDGSGNVTGNVVAVDSGTVIGTVSGEVPEASSDMNKGDSNA